MVKSFAFERGGANRLEISWKGVWREVQVKLDGAPLGTFSTKESLEAGRTFELADGSRLHVRLKNARTQQELHVSRDGTPLPGSADGPEERIEGASTALNVLAALNIAVGSLAELGEITFLRQMGAGYGSVAGGAVLVGLAWLVKSKHSPGALRLALSLFVVDTVVMLVLGLQAESRGASNVGALVGVLMARCGLLLPMWKGLAALSEQPKRRELSWTDRRVAGRQRESEIKEADRASAPPRRWSSTTKLRLAGAVAVVSAAAVLGSRLWSRWQVTETCSKHITKSDENRCLYGYAVLMNDSGICESMGDTEALTSCRAELEQLDRQREECLRLDEGWPRDECFKAFVKGGSNSVLCQHVAERSRLSCALLTAR